MSPYLWKRDSRYYFRMHIPEAIQHFFGREQIRLSLKTGLKQPADRMCTRYEGELVELFDRLTRHLRTGNVFASERDIQEAISHYIPSKVRKLKPTDCETLMHMYLKQARIRWTPKTADETLGSLTMVCDRLGENRNIRDVRVEDVQMMVNVFHTDKAPKTINKILRRAEDMFKHALQYKMISENPFAGITIPTLNKDKEKPRIALSDEQMRTVVSQICLVADDKHPSLRWVPLISMYSGLRLNEACQLYKNDIIEENGIKCFRVNNLNPGQSIKSKRGFRNIPVHSILYKEYGLQEYIDSVEGDRLFPDLALFKYGFGHSFKLFMPRFRKLISTEARCTFHSIRHSVATKLGDGSFHTVKIADVMGHERDGNSVTELIYIGKSKVAHLQELIESIGY